MHKCISVPKISRALAVLLACLLAAPVPAQTPPATTAPREINILILEGEGAINNVRQRVAREAMVQVEDENHKPIAAAAVTFFMPGDGASGVFSNGSRSITALTDSEGKAAVRGIRLNKVQGKLQMRVQASYQGLTKNTVITQTNMIGAGGVVGGAISGKLLSIILLGAFAVTASAFVIANNVGNSTPAATAATVVPGTPSVGPPR